MFQSRDIPGRKCLGGVGVAAAFGLALAAVAGGGAWAQSAAPADSTKITFGGDNTGFAQLPITIADEEGFFKKAGVNFDSEMLSGGTPTAMAALSGGSVNLVNLSTSALAQYAGKKVINGKAFAEIIEQKYDLVAAKDIKSIADLKGKAIGISSPNAGDNIYLLAVLQHYGLSSSDVTYVTTGNPVNRLAALKAGGIAATAEDPPSREPSSQVGNILLKSEDSPVPSPANVMIASSDLIDHHKPLLKKFLTAQVQALDWMRTNPDKLIPICVRDIGATAEVCKKTIALYLDHAVSGKYTWSSTMALDTDAIKSAISVMGAMDPAVKGLTVDDVADTSIAGTTP